MKCGARCSVRILLSLGVIFLAGSCGRVQANPGPPGPILRFHVQPWDPEACANPLHTCEDIVNYTAAEGDLEFDLYLDFRFWPEALLTDLNFTLQWPAAWEFTNFDSCLGGSPTTSVEADSARIRLDWFTPVELGQGEPERPLLIGRARLNVQGTGEISFALTSTINGRYFYSETGQAGTACDHEFVPCGEYVSRCRFTVVPREVVIPAIPGVLFRSTLRVLYGNESGCHVEYTSSGIPWSYLGPDSLSFSHEERIAMEFFIDSQPEVHQGTIRVYNGSQVVCIPVTLAAGPVEPDEKRSWGQIKWMYKN